MSADDYYDQVAEIVTRLNGRIIALEFMQACMMSHMAMSFADPERMIDRIARDAQTTLRNSPEPRNAHAAQAMETQIRQIKSNLEFLIRMEQEEERRRGSGE